jgi:RimJ/RimL family protein N-acetyltransferase
MIVSIRRYRIDDISVLPILANNRNIWNNMRDLFPHPYQKQDAEAWVRKAMPEEPCHNFAIDVNGQLGGGIGLNLQQDVYRKNAEIGYWVAENFWGQGIASRSVSLLCDYAFRQFDLVRLYAGIFAHNKASMRVLEKNHFILESISKKAVFKDGNLIDQFNYVRFHPKANILESDKTG